MNLKKMNKSSQRIKIKKFRIFACRVFKRNKADNPAVYPSMECSFSRISL